MRFAANLSVNPIEPLKLPSSQSTGVKITTSTLKQTTIKLPKSQAVPEYVFDWNSSGLVNPLDGKCGFFITDFSR